MSEPTPVEMLEAEHRVIQKVVAGMAVLGERLDAGEDLDVPLLENIVEFLRTFADRCHHSKEEDLLFPALERRGVPTYGCPIDGLTMEHQKSRLMVGEFAEAIRGYSKGESAARENLVTSLRTLTAFYPNHIWKEDYLLFPMAGKVLTADDQRELAEKFEAAERDLGLDVHKQFDTLALELERTVSADRATAIRPEEPRSSGSRTGEASATATGSSAAAGPLPPSNPR